MLTFNLSSKRPVKHQPKPAYTPPTQQQHRLLAVENTFNARDLIIKREAAQLDYKEGDLVRPVKQEDFNITGVGKVKGIVRQYKDWPAHMDFPESPALPQIVLVEGLSNIGKAYTCTVKYIRKLSSEEEKNACGC